MTWHKWHRVKRWRRRHSKPWRQVSMRRYRARLRRQGCDDCSPKRARFWEAYDVWDLW